MRTFRKDETGVGGPAFIWKNERENEKEDG